MTPMRIVTIDTGFCRIYYKNQKGLVFCLQDDGPKVQCYRVTESGEPEHTVQLRPEAFEVFERPEGDSDLETTVREFLESGAVLSAGKGAE